MDTEYARLMSDAVKVFEVVGVTVLVIGSILAFAVYVRQVFGGTPHIAAFTSLRAQLGRSILLGLEILVIADIVRTIVVEPTLDSALTLGVIVLVRVLLSFAIDIEVDGVAPWRKAELAEKKAAPPNDSTS